MNLKFTKKKSSFINYLFSLSFYFPDRVSNPRNSKKFETFWLSTETISNFRVSPTLSLSQHSETVRPFVSRNLSTFQSRLILETRTFCIPGLTFNVDYTTTFDLIYPSPPSSLMNYAYRTSWSSFPSSRNPYSLSLSRSRKFASPWNRKWSSNKSCSPGYHNSIDNLI